METFFALLAICAGNSPVPGEFPTQRPVTRSFDGFFDLRLHKRLSKQSWGWWLETLPRPLWRHRNVWSLNESSTGIMLHINNTSMVQQNLFQQTIPGCNKLCFGECWCFIRVIQFDRVKIGSINHVEAWTKWLSFHKRHFQINFL